MTNMYYKTNAIYKYIENNKLNNYEFCSSNLWQLVYADRYCIPRLMVVVSGVKYPEITKKLSEKELVAYTRMQQLSDISNINVKFIRFAIDQNQVDSVYLYESNNFIQISMSDLKMLYGSYGLPISKTSTDKYLNDKTSSAYHNWQRNCLGKDLKISDIDLLKVNSYNNKIDTIYELKRSIIPIEKWNPYPEDYNNFKVLANLVKGSGVSLKIAYNVRRKNPWEDDISEIKVFDLNVNENNALVVSEGKIVKKEEFLY